MKKYLVKGSLGINIHEEIEAESGEEAAQKVMDEYDIFEADLEAEEL